MSECSSRFLGHDFWMKIQISKVKKLTKVIKSQSSILISYSRKQNYHNLLQLKTLKSTFLWPSNVFTKCPLFPILFSLVWKTAEPFSVFQVGQTKIHKNIISHRQGIFVIMTKVLNLLRHFISISFSVQHCKRWNIHATFSRTSELAQNEECAKNSLWV